MPAETPTHDIPYPRPTDPITNGAATIAQLAARVDELLGESGSLTITPAGDGSTTSMEVGYSRTYAQVPTVMVTPTGTQQPAGAGWWVNNQTASGFRFNIRRSSGPGNMSFDWIARP